MRDTVPSQIVRFIESKYPQVKQGSEFHLDLPNASTVQVIIEMVDSLPSHLITLNPDEYAEFYEAVSAMRIALTIWQSKTRYALNKVPGTGMNPLTLVRKHLVKLKDEGIPSDVAELKFITDEALRESLRLDLSNVNRALQNSEWKATTVLAGSVVEALLLWRLEAFGRVNLPAITNAIEKLKKLDLRRKKIPNEMDKWSLGELTQIADELKLITATTAQQCRIAKDFRNLIHPGRSKRLELICDRGTSLSAVAAVEHVIRDLTER